MIHALTHCVLDLPIQVSKYEDPQEAAIAVVVEAYRLWLQYEVRTDDITIIIARVQGLKDPLPGTETKSMKYATSFSACKCMR